MWRFLRRLLDGPFTRERLSSDPGDGGLDAVVYDRLPALAWGLGLAFVIFVALDRRSHCGAGSEFVTIYDAGVSLSLLALSFATGRRLLPVSWAHPIAAFVALALMGAILVEHHAAPDATNSNHAVIVVFGAGIAFLSLGWYLLTVGAILLSWACLIAPTLTDDWVMHYGASLAVVTIVSLVLLAGRIRNHERFLRLRADERRQEGELREALAVARDELNQRLAAEERLRERENLLRELLDSIGSAVLVTDPVEAGEDFVLVHVNRAGAKNLWFRTAATIGRRLSQVLPGLQASGLGEAMRRVHESGRAERFPRFLYQDDIREVELELFLFRLASGSVVALFDDRTGRAEAESERQRLTEQMQRMQRFESLGHLAQGVAHRFNNLVMSMMGNAEIVLQDMDDGSPSREDVETIIASAQDASKLCYEMMACAGQSRDALEPLNLSDLVGGLRALLRVSVAKKARLELQLAEGLPDIDADPGQIRQVLVNLVTNASEALGDHGGTVRVESGQILLDAEALGRRHVDGQIPPGRYVLLQISDDGEGMSPETRARVFEPFFTTRFAGRGLGLAAALGIVRRHRGAIRVESTPGRGSQVSVYLPVSTSDTGADESQPTRRQECLGTAIIVEPDLGERDILRLVFEQRGAEVLEARGLPDLVRLAESLPRGPRLIVLDTGMVGPQNEHALDELRAAAPDCYLVLTSVFEPEEILSRFESWAPDRFLRKPIRAADAHALITEMEGRCR